MLGCWWMFFYILKDSIKKVVDLVFIVGVLCRGIMLVRQLG